MGNWEMGQQLIEQPLHASEVQLIGLLLQQESTIHWPSILKANYMRGDIIQMGNWEMELQLNVHHPPVLEVQVIGNLFLLVRITQWQLIPVGNYMRGVVI